MKTETKIKGQYRQGDVLIEETSTVSNQPGKQVIKLILAHGEVTGHCHSVEDCVTFGDDTFAVTRETEITHQEHAPILLTRGKVYKSIRQREYTPQMIRAVAD